MTTLQKTGWKLYGANVWNIVLNGETVGVLMKTQHPGNAFGGPTRFWVVVDGTPEIEGLYPRDWGTYQEAKEAIETFLSKDGE
jgi:hypothetical protein